jgi:2-dehydropantoate 2-reductase
MRVAVVGAGAMGSLFGGLMARAGDEVWLIDTWEEQVRAISREGLVVEDGTGALGGGEVTITVKATTRPDEAAPVDLVLFFVKSYHTRAAGAAAGPLFGPGTTALTLQNGLGNAEDLEAVLGAGRVLAGTTSCGATLLAPGHIRFAGRGPTVLGELSGGPSERASRAAETLRRAGFETSVSADIKSMIWGKVMVNVGINALTALTGLCNGELLDHPETREVLRAAVTEAVAVARSRGAALPWANPVEHVEEIARLTATNRSSMLQDVDHGRRTEIDAINGAIVREAAAGGVQAPVNLVLTALVKMKEKEAR